MDSLSVPTKPKFRLKRLFNRFGSPQEGADPTQPSSTHTGNAARHVEQSPAPIVLVESASGPTSEIQQQDILRQIEDNTSQSQEQIDTTRIDVFPELSMDLFQDPGPSAEYTQEKSTSRGEPTAGVGSSGSKVGNDGSARAQPSTASRTLWNRAIDSMEKKNPKLVRVLQDKLKDVPSGHDGDNIEHRIEHRIEVALAKRHDKIHGKDGAADSSARKGLRRISKFIGSTKTVVMPIASYDPHKVAPAVLGGFYFLVGMLEGATEDKIAAIKVTTETAGIVARWNWIENHQINANKDKSLRSLYQKLGDEIVVLYEDIIRLLGTLLAWFDSDWRQALSTAMPANPEWKSLDELIKSHEANCNVTTDMISKQKESDNKNRTILAWICPADTYDIRVAYQSVRDRTKSDKLYRSRCQWIIDSEEFDTFQTAEGDSVLWLNGTIGTGKTMLMARAVEAVEHSPLLSAERHAFAKFFFAKARDAKESSRTVEACLRSLLRQLSWDSASLSINAVVEGKFSEIKDSLHEDSTLTLAECVELLQVLVARKQTYIMIDGIDECIHSAELVNQLKTIWTNARNLEASKCALHLMFCGRIDGPIVSNFFNCASITTTPARSAEDQEFYISTEIDERHKGPEYSKFFNPKRDYPARLKNVLRKRARGLFRWMEIQIQFFTEAKFLLDSAIEDELTRLETDTSEPELQKEYDRLVELLGKQPKQFEVAMRLLRFIACSSWPLSAESLAEMIQTTTSAATPLAVTGVTGEEVRALLAGFVSEEPRSIEYEMRFAYRHTKNVLVLAHASVTEYLSAPKMVAKGFAAANQHSEALEACFDCIDQTQGRAPYDQKTAGIGYREYRGRMSDLLYYCCREWPRHCKAALVEEAGDTLLSRSSNFLGGKSYDLWNRVIGDMATRREAVPELWRSRAKPIDHVWHDPGKPGPGFVIVANDLSVLLDDPRVRFSDVNGQHQNLFNVCVRFSEHSTFARLLQLCPSPAPSIQVPWNGYTDALHCVVWRRWLDATEKLLGDVDRAQISHFQRTSLTRALRSVLRQISVEAVRDPATLSHIEPLPQIAKLLLFHGADIWEIDAKGRTILHWATATAAQKVVFEHAPELEHEGTRGNVQRLLRAKDAEGRTPLEVCDPDSKAYLEYQLSQAVDRDGGVLEYNTVLKRSETLWFDAQQDPKT